MRIFTLPLFFFVVLVCDANAAFSCESIKDKVVRKSCIADRVSKENFEAEAKEKAILDGKKNKELDDFVRKAKNLLTQDYKDPASAQFTNLVVSEDANRRTLCGSVNGKNSYGGYVGSNRFFVSWAGSSTPIVWNESESTKYSREQARELSGQTDGTSFVEMLEIHRRIEDTLKRESKYFAQLCQASPTNTLIKIDN